MKLVKATCSSCRSFSYFKVDTDNYIKCPHCGCSAFLEKQIKEKPKNEKPEKAKRVYSISRISKPEPLSVITYGKTSCDILRTHHEVMSLDTERLKTSFIKKLLRDNLDDCVVDE